MPDAQPSLVTPEGVRDGDPAALSGLTTRRGAAVLAYTEQVARPGRSVDAAAEAFAQFRHAVVAAADPYDVDPERTLLRTTRFAAAAVAPTTVPLRSRLRGTTGPSPCERIPELLAARAENELSIADQDRLSRHLLRCAGCSATEARFRAGERAYRAAPDVPPVAFAARAIMEALLHAAPGTTTPEAAETAEPPAPTPEPVPLDATVEFDSLAATDAGLSTEPATAANAVPAGGAADASSLAEAEPVPLDATVEFDSLAAAAAEPEPHEVPVEAAASAEVAHEPRTAPQVEPQPRAIPPEVAPQPIAAEAQPEVAPVAVLTEPEHFVPEPFDDEPYEYAPEPTVTHIPAGERQETYEFDALPEDAFDLEHATPEAYIEDEHGEYAAPEEYADGHYAEHGEYAADGDYAAVGAYADEEQGRSWMMIAGFAILALVVIAALAVVAIAITGVA
jgi:hypothetical protein